MAEEKESSQDEKKVKSKKQKPTKLKKWFNFMRVIERIFLRPIFPFKIHGLKQRYNGAYIIVGNHYSIYDVVFSCMMTDEPVHFAAKKELWDKKIMRWFCNKCECIPVNRDGNDVKAVMQMMRTLKNGEIVNIFPEGTRNHSYESFLPFHGGAAAISIKTRTPIIPFVEITRVRPFRVTHVVCGEPIEFTDYYGKKLTEEDMKVCDDKLRDYLWKLRCDYLEEIERKKQEKKAKKASKKQK